MKDLEKRISAILRGQVRSYINDHPEAFSKIGIADPHAVAEGICKRAIKEILAVQGLCGQEDGEGGCAKGAAAPREVPAGVARNPVSLGSASAGQPLPFKIKCVSNPHDRPIRVDLPGRTPMEVPPHTSLVMRGDGLCWFEAFPSWRRKKRERVAVILNGDAGTP